ncbi:MAG: hypothetical protein WKG07_01130 [Hymenobacter sp.]
MLKDEKPFTDRPNEHLAPIDFDAGVGGISGRSTPAASSPICFRSLLYPKVFAGLLGAPRSSTAT